MSKLLSIWIKALKESAENIRRRRRNENGEGRLFNNNNKSYRLQQTQKKCHSNSIKKCLNIVMVVKQS
ncbi:CLUMA_CG000346, isoform A [Clunio marinus]|uniref:CLUMA_CG000346, isoform A n=1 Tax=Clunio marinus TaxID=568069 RepID=A0A1J1HGF1_9DIPT|nr:CLUMA_CG000346, isoform A [Clunio marinus]